MNISSSCTDLVFTFKKGSRYTINLRCPTWPHWDSAHAYWSSKDWHSRYRYGTCLILVFCYCNLIEKALSLQHGMNALDATHDTTIQMLLRKNGICYMHYCYCCKQYIEYWLGSEMHVFDVIFKLVCIVYCHAHAGAASTPMRRPESAPTPAPHSTSSTSSVRRNVSTPFQPTYGKQYYAFLHQISVVWANSETNSCTFGLFILVILTPLCECTDSSWPVSEYPMVSPQPSSTTAPFGKK